MSTKKKVSAQDLWVCDTCKNDLLMQRSAMIEHLKTVHQVTTTEGVKRMQLHVDGTDFYSYVYEWKIGGIRLTQSVRLPRRGQNNRLWTPR